MGRRSIGKGKGGIAVLRIYRIGVESAAASILLLPAMWTVLEGCRRNMTVVRRLMLMLLAVYFCGVCSATGLPTMVNMRFAPRFNLIPLVDVVNDPPAYLCNTLLNLLLFVPFGFFAPLLWRQLRSGLRTAAAGLFYSAAIEVAQMFSGRLTDVDDLIVNTAGALFGYLLAKFVYRRVAVRWQLHFTGQQLESGGSSLNGLVGLAVLCTMVMYFVRPFAERLFC